MPVATNGRDTTHNRKNSNKIDAVSEKPYRASRRGASGISRRNRLASGMRSTSRMVFQSDSRPHASWGILVRLEISAGQFAFGFSSADRSRASPISVTSSFRSAAIFPEIL